MSHAFIPIKQASAPIQQPVLSAGSEHQPGQVFERMDGNGNGVLSLAEIDKVDTPWLVTPDV